MTPITHPGHAFLSYVHEDYNAVEKLSGFLQKNDVRTWLDRNDIAPGARWKRVIRRAINEGGFFIACFSPNYSGRSLTYMNEELALAIDMLRKMPPERCWFIPVLLAPCEVPDLEINATETLREIQQVHLYSDWESGARKVLSVIKPEGSPSGQKDLGEDAKPEARPLSILFLSADPTNWQQLDISRELREIQGAIMGSRARDRFQLITRMTITPRDLAVSILEARPQIIHFSGHGSSQGLIVEDERGEATVIKPEALGRAIGLLAGKIDCVVFNVANSSGLAQFTLPSVRYVISMNSSISDMAAIAFSAGFYQALGNGRSIESAFQIGCAQIALEGFSEEKTPVIQSSEDKV